MEVKLLTSIDIPSIFTSVENINLYKDTVELKGSLIDDIIFDCLFCKRYLPFIVIRS